MKYDEFIDIIGNDSLVMARKWVQGVSGSEYTKTYRDFPDEELMRIGKRVYDNLGEWLGPSTSPVEIGKIYARIGSQRYEQGFPLCEISYATHFIKKVLLNHIFAEGILPDTLQLYQTQHFIARVHDFFDLAAFYLARGFQEALYKRILSQKGVDKENIEDIFPAGSFYYEPEPDFKTFERAMEAFNLFKIK